MGKTRQKTRNGIILRLKAKWSEEGEKNTKYFLDLEKKFHNQKCIRKIIGINYIEIVDLKYRVIGL